MKIDKKTFQMLASLLILALLFWWFISNAASVFGFLAGVVRILSPFIIGLCIAFVVNIVLNVLEKLWNRVSFKGRLAGVWKNLKRPVCIVLSFIVVIGLIAAVFFIVVPEFTRTIMGFVDKIPQYSKKIEQWWGKLMELASVFALELPELRLEPQKIIDTLTGFIGGFGKTFINTTIGLTSSVVSALVTFFVALVFSIYTLAQKEVFSVACRKVLYAAFSERRVESILSVTALINRTFTSFVTGQLTEAVIIGSLCFVGMLVFNIPFASVISVLIGFTALIPVFGAFIGTIIGALLILLDTPIKALWFVVFILVLQQLENNLIYPKVVGKSVGLPAVFTLIAVTVGGGAFGFVGILISVPVCSVIYTLASHWVENRLVEKNIDI